MNDGENEGHFEKKKFLIQTETADSDVAWPKKTQPFIVDEL